MELVMPKKITILGTNVLKVQDGNGIANRSEYICANSKITSGQSPAPISLEDCYDQYPEIKAIAEALGVGNTYSILGVFGLSGNTSGVTVCGNSGISGFGPAGTAGGFTLIFDTPDREARLVEEKFGNTAWLGCFWSDPYASFSYNCPLVGDMYETYLRYRLSSATFWDTKVSAPILRQEFTESVGDLVEITIAGNLSQRPGDIVYVKADNATGLSTLTEGTPSESIKTGYYYILRAKNVIKNDGAHTTILSLSKLTRGRFYPPYSTAKPYKSILSPLPRP